MKSGIEREPAAYRFFRSLLHNMYEVLADNLIASLFLKRKAWIAEGKVPGCDQTTRILVSEDSGQRGYVCRMFFGLDFKCRCIGRHRLWRLVSPNSSLTKDCDAVIVGSKHQLNASHPIKAAFCIPCWVDGCVDLRKDPDEFFQNSRSARYNLRKVLRAEFEVSYAKDLSSFNLFYHKMYRPYILNVYNDAAQIEEYDSLKESFLKYGELLLLEQSSQVIGGLLMLQRNGIAIAYKLGILDGDIRTARNGTTSALYYYSMKRANALGFKKMRLGGSRAFLSDGVLKFKLDCCDMQIDHYSSDAYFLLKFLRMSEGVRHYLLKNSFVHIDRGKMTVASFTPDLQDRKRVNRLKKSGSRCQIARQKIYCIGEDDRHDTCLFPSGAKCIQVTD